MLRRLRYLLSDVRYWLRRRLGSRVPTAIVVLLVAGALGVGAYLAVGELASEKPEPRAPAPAPEVVVRQESEPEEPEELGFPAFATKNTTRVSGADPIANAAAVALAVFPSTGGVQGPPAVSIVDDTEWQAGIAATSLLARPVGAPVLISEDGELGSLSSDALSALDPQGSPETGDAQVFVLGAGAAPSGLRTERIEAADPAELAAAVAELRAELTGAEPEHVLVVSSDDPEWAMPAAAWSARSGDPVLFVERDTAPPATIEALERLKEVPAYVLGPEPVVSERVLGQLEKAAGAVSRITANDPVAGAIEFARYVDGTFGWNINDPGHGFVLASSQRPLDAVAAAPLSASGKWGPLLLSDEVDRLPDDLHGYLLDLKPGYVDDPTRAVYNHVWVVGDPAALSVELQAQVDELAEVARVRSGTGGSVLGPPPGTPEQEAPDKDDRDQRR